MTNQEAMRGRAWEFIKLRWRIPGAETVAELAAEFALQEVASRDARIAKLEQLVVYLEHFQTCAFSQESGASEFWECNCGLTEILESLKKVEALKEQP